MNIILGIVCILVLGLFVFMLPSTKRDKERKEDMRDTQDDSEDIDEED